LGTACIFFQLIEVLCDTPREPVEERWVPTLEKADKEPDMAQVISKDGTKIVYDKVGQGPAVVLVEGATATRACRSFSFTACQRSL